VLDHATSEIASGSKLGIAATKKLPSDGFKRTWLTRFFILSGDGSKDITLLSKIASENEADLRSKGCRRPLCIRKGTQ
jgi:3-polyprenyl-4-hydroxybenzoate decarboxylase